MVNGLDAIQEAIDNRKPDRINTYAIFVSPREFKAAPGAAGIDEQWIAPTNSIHYWKHRVRWWDDFLTAIDPLVEEGLVRYALLTQIAAIFTEREDQLSFDCGEIPRSAATMRVRNIKAGYPLE